MLMMEPCTPTHSWYVMKARVPALSLALQLLAMWRSNNADMQNTDARAHVDPLHRFPLQAMWSLLLLVQNGRRMTCWSRDPAGMGAGDYK